jgi:putative hydrolase of the HAD superfamily
VSNRHEEYSYLVEELGLLDYFEMTLAAGQVGWWKPDPRLFHYALGLLGVEAENSLYIGDNYYADVLGARAAGLNPVLVDPFEIYDSPDCPVITSIGEIETRL